MRLLRRIPLFIFTAINLLTVAAMAGCAYISYLPSQEHASIAYLGLLFPVFLAANVAFVLFWLVFKWKMTVLPLAGLLICAESVRAYFPLNLPADPPEGSIKILSYNVMAFGAAKKEDWRENAVLHYLLESKADIICLQEAQKRLLDNALDSIATIYPYHFFELKTDNYIVCFSKYPIDSVSTIEYPAKSNRSYVYEILVGKDTLVVINNHLESYRLSPSDKEDYKSIIKNYQHPEQNHSESKYLSLIKKMAKHDSIRGLQTDSVAAFVARNQGRFIVACGDFNATPISYTHHKLTELLDDAYTRSGNGPGISYNRNGMYFRIDHLLVSPNITPYCATVDNTIKESDHYPIHCVVNLGEK